jgi:hypothetical protein
LSLPISSTYLALEGRMKKDYLLSRGEEAYYLCHHIPFDRFQKEAKQQRHR